MVLHGIIAKQQAFLVVAALLTGYMFPKQHDIKDFEEFDFVIVGTGSTGGVLADRLSECPDFKVLVIEAGGDPPVESVLPGLFSFLPQSKYDWNFTSVNDSEYVKESHALGAMSLTAGRMLGGGSSINSMIYVRGCAEDFNSWAEEAQDKTWNYQNVLPYFKKSERLESLELLNSPDGVYHGTDGFLGITREDRVETTRYLEAFGEAGHEIIDDMNGRSNIGFCLPQYMIADGRRQSTAIVNLAANKDRTNLHVLKNSLVSEILFDDHNNAIGVKVITADSKVITILARKEVIVSAGAFNSPKLLMLSGIGPRDHLESLGIKVRSDLPVGKNLQNHPVTLLSITMEKSNAVHGPVTPHKMPVPLVMGYGVIDTSRTCPEYQVFNFIIPNDSEAPFNLCAFNLGFKEEICRGLLEAGKGRNTLFAYINVLHPKSRGQVTLNSKNPHDPPIIEQRLLSDERDLEAYTSYVQDYLRVLNTTYFKSVNAKMVELDLPGCKNYQFGSRDYLKCYLRYMNSGTYHDVGTCSMGAVVDSQQRVHNVQRLRVADTSILPSMHSGNTHAAAVMVAEKLADILKHEHRVEYAPKSACDDDSSYFNVIFCHFDKYFK